MYESDSGIEELLHRLGPPDGDGAPLGDAEANLSHTDDGAAWSVVGSENDSVERDEPASTAPYIIGVEWLAEQMRLFVDLHPDWEDAVGSLASYLARADDTDDTDD